jgi:UDP-N-acetylmuramoylalanine--D-glutamate ligase
MKTPLPIIQPGMRVAVLGLGISGKAAVRYALSCGAEARVSDSRGKADFVQNNGPFLEETGVAWEAGGHNVAFFNDIDLVVVSPGISPRQPLLQNLMARGVPCLGELGVAAPLIDVPVVAITGTNGKTTVTTLIGELLQKSGKRVFVGGNIGTPLLDYFLNRHETDILVLEVSSFQLQLAGDFAPDVAVLLNITPDHLDHHPDMQDYTQAKMNVFNRQKKDGAAILCADDPICASLIPAISGRLLTYGHGIGCYAHINGNVISMQWQGGREVYDLTGSRLGSPIGVSNSAAAILAVRSLELQPETIRAGLHQFQPLSHRLQLVREIAGVRYIDDSKATNTGAVLAALEQTTGKVILIAGGRHKGEDYSLLCDKVRQKVRLALVIGEAAGMIAAALSDCTAVQNASSLEEAVRFACGAAQPGDTVLLSPACSSFDMFHSYSHRGDVFAAAVVDLASPHVQSGPGEKHG